MKISTTICLAVALVLLTVGTASAATITVDDDLGEYPGADYTTIQEAVNAAGVGDTILVYPGTYNENVDVLTSSKNNLNIISTDGAAVTTVTAASASNQVFEVTADGVTINGFTVTGATGSIGIYLYGVEGCTVTNITASNNFYGIWLHDSNNNIVSNNSANLNNAQSIFLLGSSDNTLTNNNAHLNDIGVLLALSTNNTVTDNNANSNTRYGIWLGSSGNNTLINNTANLNGIDGIYLFKDASVEIRSNDNDLINNTANLNTRYGISLWDSNNNNLTSNTFSDNSRGIWMTSSNNNNLISNKILNNNKGIELFSSCNDNMLCGNILLGNANSFTLYRSSNNILCNNNVSDSHQSIYLFTSNNNNLIYNNYFNSTIHVVIEGENDGNVWNITKTAGTNIVGGPFLGGNFWATPNGDGWSQITVDIDPEDGICDLPYYVWDADNIDYLPLTYPPANQAPVIETLDLPTEPIEVGTKVNLISTFTDLDSLDTHSYTIEWGDDTTDIDSVPLGVRVVDVNHTYDMPGVYTVNIKVEDGFGEFDVEEYQYVVVYDPNGGFVTGGGWIWSELGAYKDDETLEGKATFGFVSKYVKNKDLPVGNTEFMFKVGDLNFRSTEYQWLVIAGSKAQYKGTGTINCEGDYEFMLTAIDGELKGDGIDKFRIKIWDKSTDLVIYDNNVGEDDLAEPTTLLQGGSIKIHKAK